MVVQTSDGSFSQKARNMRNNKIGGRYFAYFATPARNLPLIRRPVEWFKLGKTFGSHQQV